MQVNGDVTPRPARKSLLATDSTSTARNAAAAAAGEDRGAAGGPLAGQDDDADDGVTVPSPSVGDDFATAGPRVGRRASVRGLDVLAAVNPDGVTQ